MVISISGSLLIMSLVSIKMLAIRIASLMSDSSDLCNVVCMSIPSVKFFLPYALVEEVILYGFWQVKKDKEKEAGVSCLRIVIVILFTT